jgi:hypothetical protein
MGSGGFIGELQAELADRISYDPLVGGFLAIVARRAYDPSVRAINNALGTLITFARQKYQVNISDDFLSRDVSCQMVADVLIDVAAELALSFGLRKPAARQFGSVVVYFILLCLVLTIFCDVLTEKQFAESNLAENLAIFPRIIQQHLAPDYSSIALH